MRKGWATAALAACIGTIAPTARADSPGAHPAGCVLYTADRARATPEQCLSCHGRSGASTPGASSRNGRKDHPVGVDYRAVWSRDPEGYERTPPPEVPLVDGKVACTSCHDGAAPNASRLVALRDGRHLCLACHRM